ncbi:MAG TPA: S41 family peptidase [Ginsengibacter sp.]|nr:S41 family peptidase [Ginsengibacter sp.]
MQRVLKTGRIISLLIYSMVFISCTATRNYNPDKKYTTQELTTDYRQLRKTLEEKHPSLYWYTPKDSMDFYFEEGEKKIIDSMTERDFAWNIIAPLLSKIHCGHTSFLMSRNWEKFMRNKRVPSFPLSMKIWKDSMMVVNERSQANEIPQGSFIQSINGISATQIVDSLFSYMSTDGYADNLNYLRLSTSFPYFFRNVFGVYENYKIDYTDSNGVRHSADVNWYIPKTDSTKRATEKKKERIRKRTRRPLYKNWYRTLGYDTGFALMTVNSFTKGRLTQFYRKSFRELKKNGTQNLIIDLRINGGGDINKAVALAKYIRNEPFKVADSAYSKSKNFNPYSGTIQKSALYNLVLTFVTRKNKDGKYHFGYWERHLFKPRKRNHIGGNTYVLTNGLTFSAASLFCNIVKGEDKVTITGEETGGGWYGNSGIMIPNITLSHSGLRVRLPFFRMVQYNHPEAKGTGVKPDWYIGPNWHDVLSGRDTKIESIKDKILNRKP